MENLPLTDPELTTPKTKLGEVLEKNSMTELVCLIGPWLKRMFEQAVNDYPDLAPHFATILVGQGTKDSKIETEVSGVNEVCEPGEGEAENLHGDEINKQLKSLLNNWLIKRLEPGNERLTLRKFLAIKLKNSLRNAKRFENAKCRGVVGMTNVDFERFCSEKIENAVDLATEEFAMRRILQALNLEKAQSDLNERLLADVLEARQRGETGLEELGNLLKEQPRESPAVACAVSRIRSIAKKQLRLAMSILDDEPNNQC